MAPALLPVACPDHQTTRSLFTHPAFFSAVLKTTIQVPIDPSVTHGSPLRDAWVTQASRLGHPIPIPTTGRGLQLPQKAQNATVSRCAIYQIPSANYLPELDNSLICSSRHARSSSPAQVMSFATLCRNRVHVHIPVSTCGRPSRSTHKMPASQYSLVSIARPAAAPNPQLRFCLPQPAGPPPSPPVPAVFET